MSAPLRPLFVPMEELLEAMDRGPTSTPWYLDKSTGELNLDPMVTGEGDAEDDENQAMVPMQDLAKRHRAMEDFVAGLDDSDQLRLLKDCLKGKGSIGRFEKTVRRWPTLQELWDRRKQELLLPQALAWLASLGIEPHYELAEPAPVQKAATETKKEKLALVDILLLGAGGRVGKTGVIERAFLATSPERARKLFEQLSFELAMLHGLEWRRPGIELASYTAGRCTVVVLESEVVVMVVQPPEIAEAMARSRSQLESG